MKRKKWNYDLFGYAVDGQEMSLFFCPHLDVIPVWLRRLWMGACWCNFTEAEGAKDDRNTNVIVEQCLLSWLHNIVHLLLSSRRWVTAERCFLLLWFSSQFPRLVTLLFLHLSASFFSLLFFHIYRAVVFQFGSYKRKKHFDKGMSQGAVDIATFIWFHLSFHFLSPLDPGGSDGWYHNGDGAGPARATLLPGGRLWELPRSCWRKGVLRLRSACRLDLVGAKGKFKASATSLRKHLSRF